jgi:predicted dehydrogenase
MKILIAGLGSVGRRHLRNLLALGERDIILYRTYQGTLSDDELAAYPTETDLASALANEPQAVIIANPTALHMEVAIPAAEAGCHLFLEKPISHSLEGFDRLETALAKNNRQALVGFQFRFHPTLQKAATLLTEGAIGQPLSARAHWGEYLPGFHPWEDYRLSYAARADLGGGVTLTLCHPLDYLRWLLGEVESLWAFTSRLSDLELSVEDTAEIGLRFVGGATGTVHLDYNQRPSTHSLEIIGTQGTLRWDNASARLSVYRADAQPPAWEDYPPPERFERNDMFLAEMRHFLAVARGEEKPLCTLQDGIAALRLVLCAQQSAREGKLIRL